MIGAQLGKGLADDDHHEATTGQQAATSAEMDSITSSNAMPASSPSQQVSHRCCA